MDFIRRLEIKIHHVAVLGLLVIGYIVVSVSGVGIVASAPQKAYASGSQNYTTPGSYTFTVPSYGTLTVTVTGAGGGGGGGSVPAQGAGYQGGNGGGGGNSTFNASVVGYGGGGGAHGDTTNMAPGSAGGAGSAGGGDTNSAGAGAGGGAGGPGPNYIDPPGPAGGPGGAGGQASKTYSGSALTPGSGITVVVGSGGAAGAGETAYGSPSPYGDGPGSAGSNGSVSISWTDPVSCTFNGQTVASGASVTAYQSSSVPAGSSCTSQTRTCSNGTLSGSYTYSSCTVTPDTTPPAVSLTAPASGAELSGSSNTLSATASDNVAVVGVQFKVDNVNAGAEDTSSPYSIAWDSTSVSNGSHTVVAVARDAAGNYATSSSVSVTVNNVAADVITGYAWSDTIGWISLSGSTSVSTSYGLTIASDGTLSGYGWSDNIGWVSANTGDLSGCPSGTCRAKLVGSNLQGWLKALGASDAQSGGWDGFISLSGSSPTYGVTKNGNGTFTGYAWGSTNVGWVDFSYARTGYLVCTPSYSCSGQTIQHTDASCNVTNVTTCVSPNFCSAGSSTCISAPPTFNQSGSGSSALTGHLQAVPLLVPQNNTTKVYWNVSNVTSCSVTGTNGDHWTGTVSTSGGQVSAALTQQTTYTLSCTGLDSSTVSEAVVVNILPVFQER
jgi:Bacterial Ig domain